MKPATHEALDPVQQTFLGQLNQAVDLINRADHSPGTPEATSLLLSAIARVLVVETAAKQNMVNRLAAFIHKYSK